MKMYKLLAILGIVAFLMPSMTVKATTLGTVDISGSVRGANGVADVYGGGYAGQSVFTGAYLLNKTSGTSAGTLWDNGSVSGFCIELDESAPHSAYTYEVVGVSDAYSGLLNESVGIEKSNYLSELWGRYYDPSWTDGSYDLPDNSSAAAFAAAVWEIVYEDLPASSYGWDVTEDSAPGISGFAIDGINSSTANAWLASLDGTGPMTDLAVFTNDGNQNYLVAVPEPTTMLLLGVGGVLGAMRRKKRLA